jgi:anti-sigma factor RsiW
MTPAERLLQRYQDGEANRAQQSAVEGLLASEPGLARQAQRLERMDGLLKARAGKLGEHDAAAMAAMVMERLPAEIPRMRTKLSVAHLLVGTMAVAMVGVTASIAPLMRPWLPVEGIAAACAFAGLALVVAARPLAQLENGMIARLMAIRLTVGDGEVLVCRALGIALLIGAAHIAGLWS